MIYLISYLVVGLILVTVKSPIRALVNKATDRIEISCLIEKREVPKKKLFLFRLIISAILVLVYPVMLFAELQEKWGYWKENRQSSRPDPIAQAPWLGEKISVQEAEKKYTINVNGQRIPFGSFRYQWKNLLKQKKWRDELYEFRSPDDSWAALSGVEGIALTRKGKIIADIVTRMS